MSLFDDLKAFLDTALGVGGGNQSDFSPSQGQTDYSVTLDSNPGQQSYSPDTSKQFLENQGFSQPPIASPFALPLDQVESVITDRPSPFNVIDLDTVALQYSQSGIAGGVQGNVQGAASLAVASGTLQKLNAYVNAASQAVAPNSPANGFMQSLPLFGRTIAISSPANFLRIERLPLGNTHGQYINTGVFATSGPQKSAFISDPVTSIQANQDIGLGVTSGVNPIPDGYQTQAFASTIFSGIYIQFDSTDNPIFRAKDFEEYKLPFQTVYITFFIFDLRWRIITGQKAAISGDGLRNFRQNLHIWDGGGILDQDIYQPTAFALEQQILVDTSGNAAGSTLVSNYDPGTLITPVSSQAINAQCTTLTYPTGNPNPLAVTLASGNTSSIQVGAMITGASVATGTYVTSILDTTHFTINIPPTRATTNETWAFFTLSGGSGLTTNKGYGVLWITGFTFNARNAGPATPIDYTVELSKGFYDSTLATSFKVIPTQNYFTKSFPAGTGSYPTEDMSLDFNTPIRVTLAGFDAQRRDFAVNQQTGEILFVRITPLSPPSDAVSYSMALRGYVLGWISASAAIPTKSTIACVPFNPYPSDCFRSFPLPV